MELTFRKAVKNDADMLIEIYNSSFMTIMFFMGNVLLMDRQKNKWNDLLRIIQSISF